MSLEINGIAIHHTASDDTEHEDTDAIRRYHVEERGWSDIGYNGLIENINGEYLYRSGRGTETIGAHVKGENDHLLGLAFVGNYQEEPPPTDMIEAGAEKIVEWMKMFNVKLDRVKPHRKWDPGHTDCPGLSFPLDRLERLIRKRWCNILSGKTEWSVSDKQRLMDLAGIEAGPIDGLMGEKTRSGIEEASKKYLVDASPNWTSELRSRLVEEICSEFMEPETSEKDKILDELHRYINNLKSLEERIRKNL